MEYIEKYASGILLIIITIYAMVKHRKKQINFFYNYFDAAMALIPIWICLILGIIDYANGAMHYIGYGFILLFICGVFLFIFSYRSNNGFSAIMLSWLAKLCFGFWGALLFLVAVFIVVAIRGSTGKRRKYEWRERYEARRMADAWAALAAGVTVGAFFFIFVSEYLCRYPGFAYPNKKYIKENGLMIGEMQTNEARN